MSKSQNTISSPMDITGLSESTKTLANNLLNAMETDTTSPMVEACAVYVASNVNGDTDVTIEAISNSIASSPSDIRSMSIELISSNTLPLSPPIDALVDDIVTKLGIHDMASFPLKNAIENAETLNDKTTRSPSVCAAAGVYITARINNISTASQANIASVSDTTPVSIRNAMNDLYEQHDDIQITLPEKYNTY